MGTPNKAPLLTARELVEEPLRNARSVISGLDGECRIPEALVTVIESLSNAVTLLAEAVDDNKQAPIAGVCRKCGCTNENGCALDPITLQSCWWADATKTLCSRCAP
jgi:hypothetical protein